MGRTVIDTMMAEASPVTASVARPARYGRVR
ncbi:unannotated protein [freshwater metagenome]|uniref:Unannotated protein n=1 Tax=freshwater metagenome TaxID=449393 RepID=A0A6J6TW61_9ZZZZ